MKFKILLPALVLAVFLLAGCGTPPLASPSPTLTPVASPSASASASPAATDVVTTASIVNDNAAFEKAISTTGTWIICTLKDLTFTTDLTLDGQFKDSSGNVARKIVLCTEDANRNVTARFTLTAPKLTINSPTTSIEHGTFKGDLYVQTDNCSLVDTTVDGNVYFKSASNQSTFKADTTSKVTGTQAVK